jgi:Holliday junction DNA helicase RuvB
MLEATVNVQLLEPEPETPYVDASQHGAPEYLKDWDSFAGQGPMKAELQVYIDEALTNGAALPHILLASGQAGCGKTSLARLIAQKMGTRLIMLVPPFSANALYVALLSLNDGDLILIDEIQKMAENGPRKAEQLLHAMEEGIIYLEDGPIKLADFTLIGATTDADKLPEAIIDRFVIKPFFQEYSQNELLSICGNFCSFYNITLTRPTMLAIAQASRGVPRVIRELVIAARALQTSRGRLVTPDELLQFKSIEKDGMTRTHKAYITSMYRSFGRERDGKREYVAGEYAMCSLLREGKPGLARIERFLISLGLIDRTPQGRKLTDLGVLRAQQYERTR